MAKNPSAVISTLQMAVRVYATVFARPTLILRFAGLPLVVYAAILVAAGLTASAGFSDSMTQSEPEAPPYSILVYLATQLPLWGLSFWVIGLSSYRWHRLVLLNDVDARFAAFRLGAGGRGYLWDLAVNLGMVIVAAIFLSSLVNALVLPPILREPEPPYFLILLNYDLVGLLVLGFVVGRIGLVLPAAAVGRPLRQMEAWDRSKPWGLWHVALIILVNLPIQAIGMSRWLIEFNLFPAIADVAESIFGRGAGAYYRIIFFAFDALIGIAVLGLTIAVTAVALSHNYLGAFGSPPATLPEEPGSGSTADRPGN